jgi:hypothetical protein
MFCIIRTFGIFKGMLGFKLILTPLWIGFRQTQLKSAWINLLSVAVMLLKQLSKCKNEACKLSCSVSQTTGRVLCFLFTGKIKEGRIAEPSGRAQFWSSRCSTKGPTWSPESRGGLIPHEQGQRQQAPHYRGPGCGAQKRCNKSCL